MEQKKKNCSPRPAPIRWKKSQPSSYRAIIRLYPGQERCLRAYIGTAIRISRKSFDEWLDQLNCNVKSVSWFLYDTLLLKYKV